MATFRPSGRGWRAEVVRNGRRASKSFRTKLEAQAWARAKETEFLSLSKTARQTLHDALQRYADTVSTRKKGARWEAVRIALFKRQLPDRPLSSLTPESLARWRDERLAKVSGSSVRRELNLLSAILERATVEWGWIPANPARRVRKPPEGKGRERVITDAEVAALVAACRSPAEIRVGQAFLFALETGMRVSEICGLTAKTIGEKVAVLPDTKNGTRREVPLSPRAREMLPPDGFGLSPSTLDIHFRRVKDRAGLTFVFHDTRHTAATRIALSGKLTPFELARMFGWKSMNMALRYFNATASDIADRL